MSVHIGLMIWKEMKRQDLSAAAMAEALEVSKNRVQTILNSNSIDTDLLIRVCGLLNFNFFSVYEKEDVLKKLGTQSRKETTREIAQLKELIAEKNRVIDLKDQLLKAQTNINLLLEKGQYR